jgi:hypothetical protein
VRRIFSNTQVFLPPFAICEKKHSNLLKFCYQTHEFPHYYERANDPLLCGDFMKALIAELLVKLAENDVASKETLIQVEALQIAVTALMNALDAQTRATISKQVNKALDQAAEDAATNPDDLIKLRGCLYELIDQPRIDP